MKFSSEFVILRTETVLSICIIRNHLMSQSIQNMDTFTILWILNIRAAGFTLVTRSGLWGCTLLTQTHGGYAFRFHFKDRNFILLVSSPWQNLMHVSALAFFYTMLTLLAVRCNTAAINVNNPESCQWNSTPQNNVPTVWISTYMLVIYFHSVT